MKASEWIGKHVQVWLDPRSSERDGWRIPNPEGILRNVSPANMEIEMEDGTIVVLMAHVVTIWKAKETA